MSAPLSAPLSEGHENHVAVVGLACRLPGAASPQELWRNLRGGVESVSFWSDAELLAAGADPVSLRAPNFVRAAPVLAGDDLFDAAFFGYAPREAALLDPQHRVFLELCWEALERTGYDPRGLPGLVGVFAGMSLSSYLLLNLLSDPRAAVGEDAFQLMVSTDKDFLATRVSYHLDLRGPSLNVQTGCSTSLVAVHLACESLLSYQCDLALAGGISIQVPQRRGYFYQEGGINSPDGHTRAFDAAGAGTVFGSGAGVVVLKRLTDALADGDTVHALVRGSAVNNDGALRVGFTAPGVDGQAEVIARAQALAGVDPATIGYVEAHGTGTALGDPVELTALAKAFGAGAGPATCGLGSVKTNLGHLDAAAGIAGFLKTVLALRHRELPPSLHFTAPNPRIDFAGGPFYVPTELRPWPAGAAPRRAGVSSFGIGGTNAHVVLEEAPVDAQGFGGDRPARRPWQILPLSARTPAALEAATDRLADWLERTADGPAPELDDIAWTLQTGRHGFAHRRVAVCRETADGARALAVRDPERMWSGVLDHPDAASRPVAFLFPGGGAHHVDMGRGLYRDEPRFRAEIDRCADLLGPRLGSDLRELLFPAPDRVAEAAARLKRTPAALPALFSVEWALAQLWMDWGVQPAALIGHSLGEYVAACLAGVLPLAEALSLVVFRGELMEQAPGGAMLSLPLPEAEARDWLRPGLSLAAVNGPAQCVVSGPEEAIDGLAAALARAEIEHRRVPIDTAAHSAVMDPILPAFERFVAGLRPQPPRLPYLSNVTGTWITAAEATDPAYWARHLRQTVRFGDGVQELLAGPDRILLEVGPGRTLTGIVKPLADRAGRTALASLRHPQEAIEDAAFLAGAAGRLWLAGTALDWRAWQGGARRRVELPTYPFERVRCWVQPGPRTAAPREGKSPDFASWFYAPSWSRLPALPPRPPLRTGDVGTADGRPWLVLGDGPGGDGLAERLAGQLESAGRRVVRVAPADDLRAALAAAGGAPAGVVHLRSRSRSETGAGEGFAELQQRGLYSLVELGQALADGTQDTALWVVSDRLFGVEAADRPLPAKATLLAAALVLPQELPHLTCQVIDAGPGGDPARLAAEILAGPGESPLRALRGPLRWARTFVPQPLPAAPAWPLRIGGVYLLTGGLGGVGHLVAGHLARTWRARLVLLGRTPLPPREEWEAAVAADPLAADPMVLRLRRLRDLEEAGAEVLALAADVADPRALAAAVAVARQRFGRIDGVFHAAGRAGAETVRLLPALRPADCEEQFAAKVAGVHALAEVFAADEPDFILLFSSNAAVLGGLGATAYAAANLYLDAYAADRSDRAASSDPAEAGGCRWLSANWDGWLLAEGARLTAGLETGLDRYAMTPAESLEALTRVVQGAAGPQVVVSTGDLAARLRRSAGRPAERPAEAAARPALTTSYVAPEDAIEETVAAVWQDRLGLSQVGVHDNFFDLGGNSLIGLQVMAELRKRTGRELPVTCLFEGPTVRALARVVAGTGDGGAAAVEASQERGERRRARRRRGAVEVAE